MDASIRTGVSTITILSIPYRPHSFGSLLLFLVLLSLLTMLVLLVGMIGATAVTWGLGLVLVLCTALYIGCFLHPSRLLVTTSTLRLPTGLLFRSHRRIPLRDIQQVRTEGPDGSGESFALEDEAVLVLPAGQVVLAKSRCVSEQDYSRLVATLSAAVARAPAASGAEERPFPATAASELIAYRPPTAAGAPPTAARTITIADERITFPTGAGEEPMLTVALGDLTSFGMSGASEALRRDRRSGVAQIHFTVADRSYLLERRCCADPEQFSAVVDFFLRF